MRGTKEERKECQAAEISMEGSILGNTVQDLEKAGVWLGENMARFDKRRPLASRLGQTRPLKLLAGKSLKSRVFAREEMGLSHPERKPEGKPVNLRLRLLRPRLCSSTGPGSLSSRAKTCLLITPWRVSRMGFMPRVPIVIL